MNLVVLGLLVLYSPEFDAYAFIETQGIVFREPRIRHGRRLAAA